MIAPETVRALALALPEAAEHPHHGRPSFRVGKRIFATLRMGEGRAAVRVEPEELPLLVASDPQTFHETPWSSQGWITVDLERVDPDLFEGLLLDAWRRIAPKRALAAYEAMGR